MSWGPGSSDSDKIIHICERVDDLAAKQLGTQAAQTTNSPSLKCPLFNASKMCRLLNDKPIMCHSLYPCAIVGALQA